jgi:hypothetical protein
MAESNSVKITITTKRTNEMSDWPMLDKAIRLGTDIVHFDVPALRDELAKKRAKRRALGWPDLPRDNDTELADAIEMAQRLIRGDVSVE